jgi:hypothetical protein
VIGGIGKQNGQLRRGAFRQVMMVANSIGQFRRQLPFFTNQCLEAGMIDADSLIFSPT